MGGGGKGRLWLSFPKPPFSSSNRKRKCPLGEEKKRRGKKVERENYPTDGRS